MPSHIGFAQLFFARDTGFWPLYTQVFLLRSQIPYYWCHSGVSENSYPSDFNKISMLQILWCCSDIILISLSFPPMALHALTPLIPSCIYFSFFLSLQPLSTSHYGTSLSKSMWLSWSNIFSLSPLSLLLHHFYHSCSLFLSGSLSLSLTHLKQHGETSKKSKGGEVGCMEMTWLTD